MKRLTYLLSACLLMFGATAGAQDTTAGKGSLSVTGSADAYYRYNFANAKKAGRTNDFTSFTNSQNSFELGMASIKADYSSGKVEAVLDLGFGRRAEEFSYNDKNTLAAIKQGYLVYAPSGKVKFTMGKWATHVGYEMPDAYLNRNYSMDYMFSYGPFFHTGLKMEVTAGKNVAFMLGVANPTDMVSAGFSPKSLLAQLHLTSSNTKISGYLNYIGGKDLSHASVNQVDAVINGTICSKFSIGYNGTVKSVKPASGTAHSWWGSAVYFNYDPSAALGLTLRSEYFGDKKGVAGFGTGIYDLTLSAGIHIDNLTIIPEFRLDGAKDPVFYKHTDTNTPSSKMTGSFILATIFHF